MSYQAKEFRQFLLNESGFQETTCKKYNSYLQRIDRAKGGLDEAIGADGKDAILAWARSTSLPPFDVFPNDARSVLRKYIQFLIGNETPADEIENDSTVPDEALEPTGLAFRLEKEMQVAVRKQLSFLEEGLVEVDGGRERQVATGSIDIVAKDSQERLVVIELKAGKCPSGALEQVLGYAEALSDEEPNIEVRAVLIASDFSDRIRAASKRSRGLKLITYEFSLKFSEV